MVQILFCDTAYSQCLKNFYGFANLLYISQTGESSEEDLEFSLFNLIYFYLKLKKYFYVLGSKLILFFSLNGHIHNVASTLPNVVKLDIKNFGVG